MRRSFRTVSGDFRLCTRIGRAACAGECHEQQIGKAGGLAVTGLAYPQEGPYPRRGPVTVLVSILAALAMGSSIAGLTVSGGPGRHAVMTARGATVTLYGEGLYAADTWLIGIGNRGQDAAILLVEVPIPVSYTHLTLPTTPYV